MWPAALGRTWPIASTVTPLLAVWSAMRGRSGIGVAVLVLACSVTTDEGDSFATGPPGLGTGTGNDGIATDGGNGGSSGSGSGSGTASGTSVDGVDTTATDDGDIPGATTSACMGMPSGVAVLGEFCNEGCECASGICYSFPLVTSACSQCLSDSDCLVGGVGTCSVNFETESAACTNGELGVMCQPASDSCAAGLRCAQLLDTQGVIPDTFCSQCAVSGDCGAGQVCTPMVIINGAQPGGFLECVAVGSAPNGSYCPASGDASSCASGICAVVDIAGVGLADIGVCGPCAVDADCPGGVCQPPVVDSDGAVSSQCV